MEISAVIVDCNDELQPILSKMLDKFCPGVTMFKTYFSIEDAVESIKDNASNIIFVHADCMCRDELVESLNKSKVPLQKVVTIGSENMNNQIDKEDILAHIEKPVTPDQLNNVVKKARLLIAN